MMLLWYHGRASTPLSEADLERIIKKGAMNAIMLLDYSIINHGDYKLGDDEWIALTEYRFRGVQIPPE